MPRDLAGMGQDRGTNVAERIAERSRRSSIADTRPGAARSPPLLSSAARTVREGDAMRLVRMLAEDDFRRGGASTGRVDLTPYRAMLDDLAAGEGAVLELERGETQRVVKRRLTIAAGERGLATRWLRAPAGQVRFRLVEGPERPEATPPPADSTARRRGRPRRATRTPG